MKKFISKVGIACMAFICVVFLFEVAPAQPPGIDFSVDSCSVEKVPGEDSVLVSAWLHYLVAEIPAPAVDLHYVVKFDGNIVYSAYHYLPSISPLAYNDCYVGTGLCRARKCTSFVDNQGMAWEGMCVEFVEDCGCIYRPGPITCKQPGPYRTVVTIIVDEDSLITELDETNNECSTIYPPTDIPTLTEWGLIIFGVVLLGFITWVFLRRRKVVVSYQ
jgi:hypothetical protein